jgi:type II secretory pathway component PulF
MPLPGLFLGGGGAGQYVLAVLAILAGFYVPAGILAAVVLLTPRRGVLRRGLDAFVAAVPVLGRGVFHLGLARFCRAFHMLQKAGVPIVRCAAQSCQVVGNSAVARLLEGGADAARAGRNVSEGFSPRLGELFLQTWQVGEETGNMAEAAARLAGHAEETSQRIFTELARWVPRIIYFILMLMMAAAILSGGARIMTSVGLPP